MAVLNHGELNKNTVNHNKLQIDIHFHLILSKPFHQEPDLNSYLPYLIHTRIKKVVIIDMLSRLKLWNFFVKMLLNMKFTKMSSGEKNINITSKHFEGNRRFLNSNT